MKSWGVQGSNPDPCINYVMSIPTELGSQGHLFIYVTIIFLEGMLLFYLFICSMLLEIFYQIELLF